MARLRHWQHQCAAVVCCILLVAQCSAALRFGLGTPSFTALLGWRDRHKMARDAVLSPASKQGHPALKLDEAEMKKAEVDDVATLFDPKKVAHIPGLARAAASKGPVTSSKPQTALEETPDTIDMGQAVRMGRITSVAYCSDESVIEGWSCSRCQRVPQFQSYKVVFDRQWDLLGYVGYDALRDAVVVAFRGTDSHSWGNWINNLKTWRANKMYPVEGHTGAYVHAGFYDLWTKSSLQSNMTALVGEVLEQHPTPRLFITGHSMGGALGCLAALDLKFVHGFTEVRIWTFGAPRVGNYAWEQLFEDHVVESWRFTHNRDIVPSLPPRILGFHHVAREAWTVDFTAAGGIIEQKVLICDDSGEDPSCHNSACMLGLCTSVADHLLYLGVEMYKDALEC